jgi:DNA helicase-2/ATP-dependent DNA helicase PcrA
MSRNEPVAPALLNDVQRAAVEAGEGPLLIFAGAGSGKTRVLTHRIAYLLNERGIPPEQILAVTFTNKAAGELKARLEALAGEQARRLTVGTFHAICARFLRRDIHHLGWDHQFVIYDEDDQLALVKQALKRLDLDEKHFSPRAILSGISNAKNHMQAPLVTASRADSYFQEVVHRVYRVYEELLQENHALDFDDLLLFPMRLFTEHPAVLRRYQERYRYILVDEFQDTNAPQYRLVQLLAQLHGNVMVVGDDDQSIYRFRGAEVGNILRFETDFPGARVLKLEQNYRSTGNIVAAAQAVVQRNATRAPKELWTDLGPGEPVQLVEVYNEQEEGQFVAREVRRLQARGIATPGECAVLYRTNAQSRAVEEAFLQAGMRYKLIGGTKFYDRKEVRDVLAYIRLAANPADGLALQRIINVPPRGLGPRTLAELNREATVRRSPLRSVLEHSEELTALGTRTLKVAGEVHRLLLEVNEAAERLTVPELITWLVERTGYDDYVRDGTPEAEERWKNVMELHTVARDFGQLAPRAGLEMFLEQVALVSSSDERGDENDAVTLITLHAAKGLEFPVVFMVGMEEGLFPHSRTLDRPDELEEERRLCYVGMTRAMRRLYLTSAFRRTLFGMPAVNERSRFVAEIPKAVVQKQANSPVTWESPTVGARQPAPSWSSPSANRAQPSRSHGVGPATRPPSGTRLAPASVQVIPGAATPAPPPLTMQYHSGDKVYHQIFGDGTVISSTIASSDEEVTVVFPNLPDPKQRVKKLAASLARLAKR